MIEDYLVMLSIKYCHLPFRPAELGVLQLPVVILPTKVALTDLFQVPPQQEILRLLGTSHLPRPPTPPYSFRQEGERYFMVLPHPLPHPPQPTAPDQCLHLPSRPSTPQLPRYNFSISSYMYLQRNSTILYQWKMHGIMETCFIICWENSTGHNLLMHAHPTMPCSI